MSVLEFSFLKWDGVSQDREWIGLGNYAKLLGDRVFWQALSNTLQWSAMIVVINVGVGLALAAILARMKRGRTLIQTCFMVPVVLAPITTAIIWRWMYQPDGIINSMLRGIGLGSLAMPWLGDPNTVLPAIALAQSWSTLGLSIVIFLAGLQAVDEELYDAATIDGATPVQAFFYVTLPAIRPVTAVVTVLTVTTAFKAFDLIWAMTQGGPVRSSEILATYAYKRGALENQYGYGAAVAVALLIVVSLAAGIYAWLQGREGE
jgi:raffinose/stachyose/melibiose transport system permease protein